nr:PREDICTED: uncharacterized protein LOC103282521 [Anolis carolinensis]|eukprot:XP_016846097.1 PREDICTED: uncharacterized protein LOC103282521 [Anolis carolinensis]
MSHDSWSRNIMRNESHFISHSLIWRKHLIMYLMKLFGTHYDNILFQRTYQFCPNSVQRSKNRVQAAAGISLELLINVGVHQGLALSPLLSVVVMDAVTRDLQKPVPWTFLYADNIMLRTRKNLNVKRKHGDWFAQFGLCFNVKKTEYLTTNEEETSTIQVDRVDLPEVNTFKYLTSTITSDGNLSDKVTTQINVAWMNRCLVAGVLCDMKMSNHLKSKMY